MNSTIITLIPKIANPFWMKEYRPISCSNIVYKIYSKILAERMKVVIGDLVSKKKNAFIKGRSIADNVFLMHELDRNYHRKRAKARCVLKIDL